MPFNGTGSYAAPASTWNPAVTNTAINSTDWIALLADLTTALSTCMLKDGQQTPTANIPMGGFKFTGLAAGSAAGNSLRYEQLFKTGQVALLGGIDTAGPVNETKTTVASATSPDIWTSVGNVVDYTGAVTATGFAAAPQAGARRTLICAGAAVFTAGANMLINGIASGSNYTAVAGDRIDVVAITTTQFRLFTPNMPFVDSYPLAIGSVDGTKKWRVEVDGFTTGNTRVLTPPDADLTIPAVTAKGDGLFASASGVLAKLAVGADGARILADSAATPGVSWQTAWFKVGSFTRDTSLATGSAAVTGVGFKPKALLFLAATTGGIASGNGISIGVDDGTTRGDVYQASGSNVAETNAISFFDGTGGSARGVVNSMDTDGFTIGWTKGGAPTATLTVYYLAFR